MNVFESGPVFNTVSLKQYSLPHRSNSSVCFPGYSGLNCNCAVELKTCWNVITKRLEEKKQITVSLSSKVKSAGQKLQIQRRELQLHSRTKNLLERNHQATGKEEGKKAIAEKKTGMLLLCLD
ncbi:Uncharacterized protein Adt_33723 [Abeliophyllum distichum]|uniref:Uncharacterized protein n=1 Tax=Abeliophyllum distichum TaxID=126358 RepID=A0ABD1QYC6_9LAMI